jgi:hypothetical protein
MKNRLRSKVLVDGEVPLDAVQSSESYPERSPAQLESRKRNLGTGEEQEPPKDSKLNAGRRVALSGAPRAPKGPMGLFSSAMCGIGEQDGMRLCRGTELLSCSRTNLILF